MAIDSCFSPVLRCYKTYHMRRFIPKTSGCKRSICLPYGVSSFLIIQGPKSYDIQCFFHLFIILALLKNVTVTPHPSTDENVLLSNLIHSQVTYRTFHFSHYLKIQFWNIMQLDKSRDLQHSIYFQKWQHVLSKLRKYLLKCFQRALDDFTLSSGIQLVDWLQLLI